jgi:hypothetical protein
MAKRHTIRRRHGGSPFLRELPGRLLRNGGSEDPSLGDFTGSPEAAAAFFAREVIEADISVSMDSILGKFVG